MKENNVAARMVVCRECLALRGDFFDSFNQCERTQRCGCAPNEPLWNAFDYNMAAELCYCCAAAAVSSGSRWSVFFCDACKTIVARYNALSGAALIPIGRHSIMNDVGLSSERATSPEAVAEFEAALPPFFDRTSRVHAHRRERIRRVVHSIGTPTRRRARGAREIPVDVYLVRAQALLGSREDAFVALARAVEPFSDARSGGHERPLEQLLDEHGNTAENKRRFVNVMLAKDPSLARAHVEAWWDQAAEQLGL